MAEAVDVFADTVRIYVSAFGCALQFGVTQTQLADGSITGTERVATIRVTPEFVKGLAFMFREHVLQYERTTGAKLPIPPDMMNQVLGALPPERWDRCWQE